MRVTVGEKQIVEKLKFAKSFYTRLMGLMFTSKMKGYDGLLLSPANSIHTCFMRYAIDVLFLDKENRIVRIVRSMKPWRFTRIYWTSKSVLELPGGSLPHEIKKGDQICIN